VGGADVEEDGDTLIVGVAEAVNSACTEVEDVAVDEGDVGLAANVRDVAWDAGIVEAEHDGVGVDEGPVIRPEEDVTIPDDDAGGKSVGEWEEGGQMIEEGWVIAAEVLPGAQVAVEGRVDAELL
jgi:hypothetical protein